MTRIALIISLLTAFAASFTAPSPAHAQGRWCAVKNLGDMSENCHFTSLQQCKASLTGNSDFCRPSYNGDYHR